MVGTSLKIWKAPCDKRLNPFQIRALVGTVSESGNSIKSSSLNPFQIRALVGTEMQKAESYVDRIVLIPFKSGLWLERMADEFKRSDLSVLIPFKSGLWLERA